MYFSPFIRNYIGFSIALSILLLGIGIAVGYGGPGLAAVLTVLKGG